MRADRRLAKLAKHQQRKHRGAGQLAQVGVASLMLLVNLMQSYNNIQRKDEAVIAY